MTEDLEQIRAKAEAEIEQLNLYRDIYELTDPYPVEPVYEEFAEEGFTPEKFDATKYSFMKIMGVKATGFILAMAGSMIYSAIRTMGKFAEIVSDELASNQWDRYVVGTLVVIAAGAIVLAVEGYIASHGYGIGEKRKELKDGRLGPGVAATIATLAGILASFSLIPDHSTFLGLFSKEDAYAFFQWNLAFVGGVGVVALVHYGAENYGAVKWQWEAYLAARKKEIDDANAKAKAEIDSHNATEKARIDQENKDKRDWYERVTREWHERFENDYRRTGRAALFDAGTFTVKRNSGGRSTTSDDDTPRTSNGNGLSERIRNLLHEMDCRPSQVGDFTGSRIKVVEIANTLELTDKRERDQVAPIINRFQKQETAGRWV